MGSACRIALLAFAASVASGCTPDVQPLSPVESARLQQVYREMAAGEREAIQKNLRFAGLYKGSIDAAWGPALSLAAARARAELSFLSEDIPIDSDSAAAHYLTVLASQAGRSKLVDAVGEDIPAWKLVEPAPPTASVKNGECTVAIGRFKRNGESALLAFYRNRNVGGLHVAWDGWITEGTSIFYNIKIGDQWIPSNGSFEGGKPFAVIRTFNGNGWWITDAMKISSSVELDGRGDFERFEFSNIDLRRAGLALSRCADDNNLN